MCLPCAPLQCDGGDGGIMAKDDAASRQRAEKIAHANARYTLNLLRAFGDLLPKLERAYEQPARDAADERSQHAVAQLAVAQFLKQVGPDYLAPIADQFVKLAQALNDLDNGIRVPIFDLAQKRSDPTVVWLARACVAVAVEIMRQCGHSRGRERAAKLVAKKHPGLEQLITESGSRRRSDSLSRRSDSLEKAIISRLERAIISWCENFSSHKIRNEVAAGVYDKLKAWASNLNSDQMESAADQLLQGAVAIADLSNPQRNSITSAELARMTAEEFIGWLGRSMPG